MHKCIRTPGAAAEFYQRIERFPAHKQFLATSPSDQPPALLRIVFYDQNLDKSHTEVKLKASLTIQPLPHSSQASILAFEKPKATLRN